MQFKDRLKELREESGLTQEQIADKLNVTRQMISNYEKGNNEPSLENLVTLANIFNCSLDYLLCRTKEKLNINLLTKDNKDFLEYFLNILKDFNIKKK